MSRPHPVGAAPGAPRLQVDYVEAAPGDLLAEPDVLAVLGFGNAAPLLDDPRYLRVPLQPHGEAAPLEVWRTRGPVHCGRETVPAEAGGTIAWSCDGELLFGAIEVDEPAGHTGVGDNSGILLAAEYAYREMSRFLGGSDYPHLLRVWNYLDAITVGDGDTERYRQFCVGRAQGLGDFDTHNLPAATAIGRCDDARTIQVYWLAARLPGTPVENPRQVSAYRYPREHGPQSPSFARAMLPPAGSAMPLLLSGTASIVGHASQHEGELLAQLDETFANFDALIASARARRPDLPPAFGPGSRLKVYVRDAEDLPLVAEAFEARFGDQLPRVLLHAAICRRELALEIDGVHSA